MRSQLEFRVLVFISDTLLELQVELFILAAEFLLIEIAHCWILHHAIDDAVDGGFASVGGRCEAQGGHCKFDGIVHEKLGISPSCF